MDPIKPKVTIMLDRERPLQFTFGAARAFKTVTGRSLFDGAIWNQIDEDTVPALIWALLPRADRAEISVDDVAELVDFGRLGEIMNAMTKLYGASVSEGDGGTGRPTEEDAPSLTQS